ncbi:hypothetical protein SISSUDRAFT_1066048 [Sistotremastrum suecicum HHB10207 ss-3]|uniref:WW domain-containing protein n=1 Tax=Sistotremastrum suecicum HHB10207 ss-3 TaxID=1314776 RepID=A0A165YSP3_9AGAM|nr:hypothetical protein SISSUDRAFT_1066048 [Sistotremastrum suecicum HHB10207 ss-3]
MSLEATLDNVDHVALSYGGSSASLTQSSQVVLPGSPSDVPVTPPVTPVTPVTPAAGCSPDQQALGLDGTPAQAIASQDPVPPYTLNALDGLRPISPSQSRRYVQRTLSPETALGKTVIPPGLFSYRFPVSRNPAPVGWTKECHPEGQPYWRQPEKSVVTTADMTDEATAGAVIRWVQQIDTFARSINLPRRPKVELVLEPETGNGSCGYYFADGERQCIFWLTVTDSVCVGFPPTLPPSASFSHTENILRQQYYTHLEYFPNHIDLSENVEDMLLAILAHAGIDGMTCLPNNSTFPFDPEQCHNLLGFLRNIRDYENVQAYRTCAIARLLSEIYTHRVINFHGDRHARMSRLDTVWTPQPVQPKPFWIVIAECAFWRIPTRHHRAICDLWVDRIAYVHAWNSFLDSLGLEWERSIAHAVASLMCNLLLKVLLRSWEVVPSQWIDVADGFSTAAVALALVGLLSGVIGLQMRSDAVDASEIVSFLERKEHPISGLSPLAILFSVPFAACLWSLAFLSLATITATFGTTTLTNGVMSLCPAILTICLIYISLDHVNEVPGVSAILRFVGDAAHKAANWLQNF